MKTVVVPEEKQKTTVASGIGHRVYCSSCRDYHYSNFEMAAGAEGDVLRKTCQKCGACVDFVWVTDRWVLATMIPTLDNFVVSEIKRARKRVSIKEFLRQYDEAENMALAGVSGATALEFWVAQKYKKVPPKVLLARIKEKRLLAKEKVARR